MGRSCHTSSNKRNGELLLPFLCCAETEQPKVRSKLPEYDEKELTLDPRNPRDEELARMIEVADMADSPGFKTSRMNRGGNVLDDWDA